MSIAPFRSLFTLLVVGSIAVGGCTEERPSTPRTADSSVKAADTGGVGGIIAAPGGAGFAAGTPVVDSSARFSFELKPSKGDVLSYRLQSANVTEISGKKMTENTVYNFTITVTGLNDDGSMTVEMRHDSIRIRRGYDAGLVDTVARTIVFDSRRPDTSIGGTEQYTALIGKRVNMTLGKQGEVKEVSNVDPVLNAMFGAQRDKIPPKQWEQFRALVKIQAYSGLLEQLFLKEAPDSTVAPGREWTRTYDVPAMGVASKNTVRYKLAEVRITEGRPLGRVVMKLTTQFLQKKIDNELVSASIDEMKAEGQGEAVILMDRGWPVRKSTAIEMRMKMTGATKAGPEKGKTNTLSQAITTRLTLDLVTFTPGS